MSKTSHSDIRKAFSDFTDYDYVEWLHSGLTKFYSKATALGDGQSASSRASSTSVRDVFTFASPLIGRGESLLDDLEDIYDNFIPEQHQLFFRHALGRLLKQCATDARFPEQGISDLIYLMARIRAHESLDSLPITLGRGKLGQEKNWLQYESLSTLKRLLPSDEATTALRQMVTLPNFNDAFSLDILLALSRADPGGWLSSLRLLQPRIFALYRRVSEGNSRASEEFLEAVRQFIERFASSVPTSAIADQLSRFIVIGENSKMFENGSWIVDFLFIGEAAPLSMQHDNIAFEGSSERIRIPIIAKTPPRASEMIWDTANYRSFCRLRSHREREYLTNKIGELTSASRPNGNDPTTDLLVTLNAPLISKIYGLR